MKSFIISMDAECWKIIKKGDYQHIDATKQVPLEIEDLNEAQLKELEKNPKSLRLLTGGLGDSDKRKILSSLTAKEKWDALEKIHAGSEDVKQDKNFALPKITTTYVCMRRKPLRNFRRGSCPS